MRLRLLNLLTVLSLLLCVAVCMLWARRGGGTATVEVVTQRGICWQFTSFQWLSVRRIGNWPEVGAVRSTSYSFARGPRERSLFLLVSQWGGARSRSYTLSGALLNLGTVCVVVDPSGRVWRGPPWGPGPVTPEELSPPLPFWQAAVRHELAALALALLPAVSLGRVGWEVGRRSCRRRRGRCAHCGYDLRATPGWCPECGAAATAPA